MNKILFTAFTLLLYFTAPLYPIEKVTVAVLDLAPKGVPKIVSTAISDIVRAKFANIGNFILVERSQMNAILEENELQMTGCTDSDCAVDFGKLLSARRIVVGEVSRIEEPVIITLRYVDVQSGSTLFSAMEKSDSMEDVDQAAAKIAEALARKIVTGDKEIITPITPQGYYLRCIVPGWGQIFAGQEKKGYVFLGSFITASTIAVYTVLNYNDKKNDYEDLPRGTPQEVYNMKYDDAETAGYAAGAAVSITALIYIAHWIDACFFSKPDFSPLVSTQGSCINNFSISRAFLRPSFSPDKGFGLGAEIKF